jgi:hypothetical protein
MILCPREFCAQRAANRAHHCCYISLEPMNNFPRTFMDGRSFLIDSPFRSGRFWIVTALGLGAFATDILILILFRHLLSVYIIAGLAVLVGVQIVYQWWRILRYYARIRSLYSMKSADEAEEGSPLDLALRVAAGGLSDLLFYCFGMALIMLVVLGAFLAHIDRPR